MKAGAKTRYLLSLLGLGGAFVLVSILLAGVFTSRMADRGREVAATLLYEPVSRATTGEEIQTRLSQIKASFETLHLGVVALQVVAFDAEGRILAQLGQGSLAQDWATFPPVRDGAVKPPRSPFGEYTIVFPLPKIPGAVVAVRMARFGAVSKATLGATLVFGAWIVIGCAFISLVLILIYFRSFSAEAMRVFGEILAGNLKARFRPRSIDAVATLMALFNRMADEIERLIAKVREAQSQRTRLLQEISHDTRTPLTAARTSLEMVHQNYDRIGDVDRKRCIEIAHHEVLYLHHLIDDLFFLAEIDEPRAEAAKETVDIRELVDEELRKRRTMSDVTAQPLRWTHHASADVDANVVGAPHLFTRLIRNAFDNAARHAKTEVQVTLSAPAPGRLALVIENDGAVVPEDKLRTFGLRRPFEKRTGSLAGGQSLGLGSVIMRKIATLHGGELRFSARPAGGARLEVIVKKAA